MKRKTLTLNEILNLNRIPTLQEMVDLSVEDYTKYLYHKGVIKYIPENIYNYQNNPDDENDFYFPDEDIVLELKNPNGSENINGIIDFVRYWDGYGNEDYMLNESLEEIIDESNRIICGADGTEYIYGCLRGDKGVINYQIFRKNDHLDTLHLLNLKYD